MKADFKAIALMLATQAGIHLGTIPDPIHQTRNLNLDKAGLFLTLLEVLEEKTRGNLSEEEHTFLAGLLENLGEVMRLRQGGEKT